VTPEELENLVLTAAERVVGSPFPCPLNDEQVDALRISDIVPAAGGRSCANCIHRHTRIADGVSVCVLAGLYSNETRKELPVREIPSPKEVMCDQWKRGYRYDGPVTSLPLGAN